MTLSHEVAKAIHAAPDEPLLTAPDIAKNYLGKDKVGTRPYKRLKDAIYHFGWRHGLSTEPDNAVRDDRCRVKKNAKGKPILMEGHVSSAWYGWHWKMNIDPPLKPEETEEIVVEKPRRLWMKGCVAAAVGFISLIVFAFSFDTSSEAWTIYKRLVLSLQPSKAL